MIFLYTVKATNNYRVANPPDIVQLERYLTITLKTICDIYLISCQDNSFEEARMKMALIETFNIYYKCRKYFLKNVLCNQLAKIST